MDILIASKEVLVRTAIDKRAGKGSGTKSAVDRHGILAAPALG